MSTPSPEFMAQQQAATEAARRQAAAGVPSGTTQTAPYVDPTHVPSYGGPAQSPTHGGANYTPNYGAASQGGDATGDSGLLTSGVGAAAGMAAGSGSGGSLSGLADLAGKVLADGKIDANDIPGIGTAALGFLGVDVQAGAAAGRSPLGQLLEFVVSKIEFLADPLAKLLGSAELVTQQAEDWNKLAAQFEEAGKDHAAGTKDMPTWTGAAATEYNNVHAATSRIFPAAAQGGKSMAVAVVKAGEMVAEVRSFIWELLADFLKQTISSALSALASAVPTFGASITAFAAWFIGGTATMASRFATMVKNLLKKAADIGKVMKAETAKLDEAAKLMKDFTAGLTKPASGSNRPQTVPLTA